MVTVPDLVTPTWEYAPAPEARDIVTIRPSYGLFIDGQFVDPRDGSTFKTVNPATEEVLAEVAAAGPNDVDAAVAAARRAQRSWARLSGGERAKYLYRIARTIQERSRELAVLESIDNGKPIKETRDVDLPLVAAHFFYYAGWADKLAYAGFGPEPKPVGVCGQVIPWNFPLLMLAWKIAPALAAGNTVVLKPAETTPLTALLFAEICQQVDLPPGVVNIVTGAGETGALVVEHPGVDKVAFTGSTEVGKLIQRRLAGTGKKLSLELGGKAANVLFEDAPVDQAVEGIVNGIFFNQGHVCCAGSRRRPARQEHRHRRHQLFGPAGPHHRARDGGRGGGGHQVATRLRPPLHRLLVRAHDLHWRGSELADRARGDLRPGVVGAHVPDTRGSGGQGQQHAVRAVGRCVDGEGVAHPVDGEPPAGRRGVGQHLQPLRPDVAVRRLQGVGLRA